MDNNYIEGTFFKDSDGSFMLHIDGVKMVSLTDGKAVKVKDGGEWVSGIHIDGELLHRGGKDRLLVGDKIRIRK